VAAGDLAVSNAYWGAMHRLRRSVKPLGVTIKAVYGEGYRLILADGMRLEQLRRCEAA
jgi:DNA-binding response OmpR family regulator